MDNWDAYRAGSYAEELAEAEKRVEELRAENERLLARRHQSAHVVARAIHNHESVYVVENGCRDWRSHLGLAESICADLPKPDKARLIQAVAAVLGPLYELGSVVAEADAEVVVEDIWPLL